MQPVIGLFARARLILVVLCFSVPFGSTVHADPVGDYQGWISNRIGVKPISNHTLLM